MALKFNARAAFAVSCLCLCFFLVAQPAAAQSASGNATPKATYGDWQLVCQNGTDAQGQEGEICAIFQNLVDPESSNPIAQLAGGYWGPERKRGVVIRVPLGVALPPGVEVAVDGSPLVKVPYIECRRDGCQAHMLLDDKTFNAFRRGNAGKIVFQTPSGQTGEIDFSLKGFTKGFSETK